MIAVLLAKTSKSAAEAAASSWSSGPAAYPPSSEMNWLGSLPLTSISVVDQSVSSGLVIATVITTSSIARGAVRRLGRRIAGASCEMLYSPENARNAPA
jgi:hypothetical protein